MTFCCNIFMLKCFSIINNFIDNVIFYVRCANYQSYLFKCDVSMSYKLIILKGKRKIK